jgi:predicted dehydrogenase
MTSKLRYGVVGCGHLGRFHTEKIAAIENATLTAAFDIIPEKTTATAQQTGCRDCRSIGELLDNVDAVSIVVPTESHFAEAKRALDAGKHVLVEKPIATTEAEGRELTELAARKGLKLQVGHIERFNPAFAGLGLLPGPPRFIEGHRLTQFSPRGLAVAVILELMIHDLDLLLSVVKSPVQDVHASAVAVVSDKPDIANARIEFANGTVANLTASRISVKKMRKLRLFSKDNYLSVDFLKMTGEHFVLAPLNDTKSYDGYFCALQHEPTGRKIMFRQLAYPAYDMLTAEISSFVDAVMLDKPVRVNGTEATAALALAKRIETIAMDNLNRIMS